LIWPALFALTAAAALPEAALTELRRGDCAGASAALEGDTSLGAAIAIARCGLPADLEGALRAVGAQGAPAGDDAALEPYARLMLARQRVEDDPAAAEGWLLDLSLPGAAGLEARLLRARAQISQGRSLDARGDLRKLLDTDVGPEARYWLARGAQTRGDTDPAVATYRATWARHPGSPWADAAAERLEAMGRPVPDLDSAEGRALALQRADNLVRVHRAPEAIPLYDGIAERTNDTSTAWVYKLGMALFAARDHARACRELEKINPTAAGVYGGVETAFQYALGLSRAGDYAAAADAYRQVMKNFPGTKRADFASFKIGYLDYDAHRLEQAIPELRAHLARLPRSRHADEALWFIGWSEYRLGRYNDAALTFEKLIRLFPSSGLSVGARYWKARILEDRGDAEAAASAFDAIVRSWPVNGYAWFAAQRLDRSFPSPGPIRAPTLPDAFVSARPELTAGLALEAAGQLDWARERMVGAAPAARAAGRDTALAMAHALIRVGAYRDAQALARPFCGNPWSAEDKAAQSACYPRPEESVVTAAAWEAGLTPLLPYAIMTAESALMPAVTSPAGARGLMQLMPFLGEELHEEMLPGSPFDPDLLYRPGYNAWLGTTELGRLEQRFGEEAFDATLPLVISGYNGGVEAVERWVVAADGHGQGDRFAEDIGYTETRRYVRVVLGYLMAYRWIYGDAG